MQEALRSERDAAAGLRRELQALAMASRSHLEEFGAMADSLNAVSQVRVCGTSCNMAPWVIMLLGTTWVEAEVQAAQKTLST